MPFLNISKFIFIHFMAMNLLAFYLFWLDKRRATVGTWRVPEHKLLYLAMLGGSLGALLAQQIFRHKTMKQPFRAWLIAIAAFHIALAIILLVPSFRAALLAIIAANS